MLTDAGEGWAPTCVFLLELAGIRSVGALHGGLPAWLGEGGRLVTGEGLRGPLDLDVPIAFETVATVDDLRNAYERGAPILDVRSQLEHEGVINMPCCHRGSIPGAMHLDWTSLLSLTGELLRWRSCVARVRRSACVTTSRRSRTAAPGLRSAVAALALRSAGFEVRNALGSWHEWSLKGLPRASGGHMPS